MKWMLWFSGFIFSGAACAADPKEPTLEKRSYLQLTELIRVQQGKIILVDVWGEFCLPCKKKFPQFVELHEKYRSKGLVAVSVCVDDPKDEDAIQRVTAFLKEQKATTRNVLLTDPSEVWLERWKIDGPPLVFLFDAEGKLVNRWADKEIDYVTIEKRIQQLLPR